MSYTFKKKPLFINGKVVYEYILSEEGMPLYYVGGFFKTIQINDVDEFINIVLSSDDATHITLNNLNQNDFDKVINKSSRVTPVPGGVGALTTTILIKNACEALIKNEN